MFTSPMSLTMTANLMPFLLESILLTRVVLPLPRYPVRSSTGISLFSTVIVMVMLLLSYCRKIIIFTLV